MLKLHHIGILVDNIDSSIKIYQALFSGMKISDKVFISSQGVHVCFIEIPDHISLELIESVDEDSKIYKLRKKGFTYSHLAYHTENYEKAEEHLFGLNFKKLEMFNSEAFADKKCAFFMSPEMHMIEVIEE